MTQMLPKNISLQKTLYESLTKSLIHSSMKKEMHDEISEEKRDRAKLKHSKHKAKLQPYKRRKYRSYEDEDV